MKHFHGLDDKEYLDEMWNFFNKKVKNISCITDYRLCRDLYKLDGKDGLQHTAHLLNHSKVIYNKKLNDRVRAKARLKYG